MTNDDGLVPTVSSLPFNGQTYTIDRTGPAITAATSSTADGPYKDGKNINISLNFSELVSTGGLTINLNSGASVSTGALGGVTTVNRTYTVQPGDNASDLTITSITGMITDKAGNNTIDPAVPAGQNIADSKDITVDTTKPVTTAVPGVGVHAAPAAVELTCNDGTGSGCAKTVYCLGQDCTTWKLYTGPIAFNGQRYLSYRSLDNAGNWETAVTNISYTICTYSVTPATMTTGLECNHA